MGGPPFAPGPEQPMNPSRPKQAAFLLSVLTLLAAPLAAAPTRATALPETASLTFSFTGIEKPVGFIMAGVFDSAAAFDGGSPVRSVRIPVNGVSAKATLSGLKPGLYAIKAYHDRDSDGRMDINPFGLPTEPYAASRNAPSRMAPPAWADAVFELRSGDNTQTLLLK